MSAIVKYSVAIAPFLLVTAFVTACSKEAATEDSYDPILGDTANKQGDPATPFYLDTPLFNGTMLKAWSTNDSAATLYAAADGSFTVKFIGGEAWFGNFTANTSNISLNITNHGEDDIETSPYQGEWTYTVAGDRLELSREGSDTLVFTELSEP